MLIRNVINKILASFPNVKSISDNAQRFQLATDDHLLSAWEWDLDTGLVCFDQRFFEHSGGVISDNVENLDKGNEHAFVMFDWIKQRAHPQDKEKLLKEIDEYLKGEKRSLDIIFRIYDANYQCLTVHCRGAFARNSKSRMLGVFSFFSTREQTEKKLSRY